MQTAEAMLQSNDKIVRSSGYRCLGLIYEIGGADLQPNLDSAIRNFKEADSIFSCSISMCDLARAYMKKGKKYYPIAYIYLETAKGHELIPEVLLGLAEYFQNVDQVDLCAAKKCYIRAAMMGNFAGFFGYSKILRRMNHFIAAFLVDCLRIAIAPFIILTIGKRALIRF